MILEQHVDRCRLAAKHGQLVAQDDDLEVLGTAGADQLRDQRCQQAVEDASMRIRAHPDRRGATTALVRSVAGGIVGRRFLFPA